MENQAIRTKLDAAIKKNVNRDTALHRDFKTVRSQVVAKQMQLNGALRRYAKVLLVYNSSFTVCCYRIQYLLGETKQGTSQSKENTSYVAQLEKTVAELTKELKATR